jgi:hypothetical protein|tara:strand:+ start:9631 stop:9852 length:222 start_codon:yes stop_codon:yes gene_type:complete
MTILQRFLGNTVTYNQAMQSHLIATIVNLVFFLYLFITGKFIESFFIIIGIIYLIYNLVILKNIGHRMFKERL